MAANQEIELLDDDPPATGARTRRLMRRAAPQTVATARQAGPIRYSHTVLSNNSPVGAHL